MKNFMKKIIICCIALTLSLIPVKDIHAFESIDPYTKKEIFTVENQEYEVITSKINEQENLVNVYDPRTGEIIASALFKSESPKFSEIYKLFDFNHNSPNALVDDYDKWASNWGLISSHSMDIGWTVTTTSAGVVTLVSAFLNGWYSAYVSIASYIGQTIYDYKYRGLWGELYIKQNLYCSILRHEELRLWGDSSKTKHIRTEARNGVWTTSPWDYSTDAACRILTQRY